MLPFILYFKYKGIFTMMPTGKYITKKQLKLLDAFLRKPHDRAEPMSLSSIHGFFCALAASPNMIMPSQWQPIVLGGHPEFETMDQAKEIIGCLTELYNSARKDMDSIRKFQFLLWENSQILPIEQCSDQALTDWCAGYLEILQLDEAWVNDEAAIAMILPLSVLAGRMSLVNEKDFDGNIITCDLEYKAQYKSSLKDSIFDIYTYWQDSRMSMAQPSKSVPHKIANKKIGRNDLCSCGSNIKYKKCCGGVSATKTLH